LTSILHTLAFLVPLAVPGKERAMVDTRDQSTDEATLKDGGFIRQARPDSFAVRVKTIGGDITADQLAGVARLAERFGSGELHLTVRQGVEITNVPMGSFAEVRQGLAELGLSPGPCGPRVRGIVACPGSTACKRGLTDTKHLAHALDDRLGGRGGLPHKFKMAVTGCTASCAKPQENEVGFQGAVLPILDEVGGDCIACDVCADVCPTGAITYDEDGRPIIAEDKCEFDGDCVTACPTAALGVVRSGWRAYVGGKFGREPKLGLEIGGMFDDDEALAIAERAFEAFKELGDPGERMRVTIDRVGFEGFRRRVLGR
jgi:dissimilatory sulfite reductase (desulfoviridin) alpha/beta subunit